MGFVNTPELMELLDDTPKLGDLDLDEFGTAALVDLKLTDGSYLVDGKTVTGFANAEELITGQQQYSGRKVAQMVIDALGT